MKKPRQYNTHHCIPKFRWGTNSPANLKTILITKHRALHCLYDTQTPDEQLITNLTINERVLREEFKRDIVRIIQHYWEDYLIDWVKKKDSH
jgi:hypothetical protein